MFKNHKAISHMYLIILYYFIHSQQFYSQFIDLNRYSFLCICKIKYIFLFFRYIIKDDELGVLVTCYPPYQNGSDFIDALQGTYEELRNLLLSDQDQYTHFNIKDVSVSEIHFVIYFLRICLKRVPFQNIFFYNSLIPNY